MNETDLAERRFREGFACSQAVLAAYADEFGLPEEAALKLADGFGAGMAGLGKTCGAVTGAMMVVGLCHGRTRPDDQAARMNTATNVRRLIARFTEKHGSVTCRDLIGGDIDTPEKVLEARARGVFTSICAPLVRTAAELARELTQGSDVK